MLLFTSIIISKFGNLDVFITFPYRGQKREGYIPMSDTSRHDIACGYYNNIGLFIMV